MKRGRCLSATAANSLKRSCLVMAQASRFATRTLRMQRSLKAHPVFYLEVSFCYFGAGLSFKHQILIIRN